MDYKLELVLVPVTDVDRAKEFYVEKCGFKLDVDHQPNEEFRVVQMTPPGLGVLAHDRDRDSPRRTPGSLPRHAPGRHRHRGGARRARSDAASRSSEIRHMTPSGWQPGPDPSAATTARSPTSAIPTATPGCCRRSTQRADDRGDR